MQEFLAQNGIAVKERTDAGRARLGRYDALQLTKQVSKVIVAKGKRVTTFDLKRDPPDTETLLKAMLGPTGNLRAPAVRIGSTLLVGFNEDVYNSTL